MFPSASSRVINVYGGSTTYDIAVPDGSTWPEILQNEMCKNWTVLNFGVPGYSSVENLIQTTFYSDIYGRYPECAIYYLGWNDIRNAHIPNVDSGYANFHLLAQIDNLDVRPDHKLSGFSPTWILLQSILQRNSIWPPRPFEFRSMVPVEGAEDVNLAAIYARNIEAIINTNKSRGVKTVFVGQILNIDSFKSEGSYGWLPLVRDIDIPPLLSNFNEILRKVAKKWRKLHQH